MYLSGKVANVVVRAGQATEIDNIKISDPTRCSGFSGATKLWQIGIPDHTSGEFRHGDDYHHWGMWLNYTSDFPKGVAYTIGTSDPRKDFNYAQPLISTTSQTFDQTLWSIDFDLPQLSSIQGNLCLTLGFASLYFGTVHSDYKLQVSMNNQNVINYTISSSIAESTLVRVGIEGVYRQISYSLSTSDFKTTANVMKLNLSATTTTPDKYIANAGVMYDFILLEGVENKEH